jgi:nucleoid-associated protein YgaU
VQAGDSLWHIAQIFYGDGTRWTEIADANGIDRNNPLIFAGQVLVIP